MRCAKPRRRSATAAGSWFGRRGQSSSSGSWWRPRPRTRRSRTRGPSRTGFALTWPERCYPQCLMCGIVGYVGPDDALPIVLEGLRRLEYRGYDSAGVAVVDGGLEVVKREGKLAELEQALDGSPLTGSLGMGHTRWATHGVPSDRNAHPHADCGGRVAVIHNGIIENFTELRTRLEKEGHTLESETDTECIAHLIEEKAAAGLGLADAVRAAIRDLDGAYAIVVVSL